MSLAILAMSLPSVLAIVHMIICPNYIPLKRHNDHIKQDNLVISPLNMYKVVPRSNWFKSISFNRNGFEFPNTKANPANKGDEKNEIQKTAA